MDNARLDFIMKKIGDTDFELAGFRFNLQIIEQDLQRSYSDEAKDARDNFKAIVERLERRREELVVKAASIKKSQAERE